MVDLPSYPVLADAAPGNICGLLVRHAESALTTPFEFAWQRDRALIEAIDRALRDAANHRSSESCAIPRWLDGLVHRELRAGSGSYWSGERFVRIRLLERLGIVTLEPNDTYVLAMVSGLGPAKAEKLRSDPALVERALWRLFEVEGGGEVSLRNVDRFSAEGWRKAFLELTADGTLDRARVLSACLRALNRDFAAYRAGWFSATYLALEPTLDELVVAQSDLRRLLSASVPATVAFALKQFIQLQKAGRLDTVDTLSALGPATLVKPKGTALDALRLARSTSADHPEAAISVAKTALAHPHSDVQRTAAGLLTELGAADSVVAAQDQLSYTVRQEVGFGVTTIDTDPVTATQTLAPAPGGVTSSELAERTAALLEDASDVGELEAVLAALATPGSEDALEPLRKRAKAVVARGPRTDIGDTWLPGQIARLVLGLLGQPVQPAEPDLPAQRFLVRRIAELRRTAAPLLAAPDLPGGWVSPAVLVERLRRNPEPRHYDLIAALLRLHPDGRQEVAGADVPAAVRFALDGEQPPRQLIRGGRARPKAWRVAAERSRAPYDSRDVPQLNGDIQTHTWRENGRDHRSWYTRFAVTASITRTPADDQPTELVAGTSEQWDLSQTSRSLGDWIPALAAVWPQDAEHFLSMTCLPVLEAPSWTETAHDVPRILDALARHPGRMGALAASTLAAGMSAAQRQHRLHAVDAFLDLVPTGRIAVAELAAPLARYAQAWPANRWAQTLTSISHAPGGAEAVVDLLTALLPQLPTDHRGLNKLLDLLREETIRLGLRVKDPLLLRWLDLLTGNSAAAKTARRLLG